VIPHIGAIPLQKLSPIDLNQLYRMLLESGRCRRAGHSSRPLEVRERAVALRADSVTYEQVAEHLRASSTNITREIYTHVTPPMQSDAAERVGALIIRPS
jgi:hypothetical protein